MSAFLGPIHYWMYHKILWHEALLSSIQAEGLRQSPDTSAILSASEAAYGSPASGELGDVIAHDNIHGWLQERVTSVETRIAYVVTALLKQDILTESQLAHVFAEHGRITIASLPVSDDLSPSGLFKLLNNHLLEGMPCDSINKPVVSDDHNFGWVRTQCIHQDYWNQVGGHVSVFYRLRDALIHAFVKGAGDRFQFQVTPEGTNLIQEVA
jgi:hypothetical protein